jgi:hypothetical protein
LAELLLLAEGDEAIFPLLHLVVDFDVRHFGSQRRRGVTSGTRYINALISVVAELMIFVPISQIVMLQPPRRSATTGTTVPSHRYRPLLRQAVREFAGHYSSVGIAVSQFRLAEATSASSATRLLDELIAFTADPSRAAQSLVAIPGSDKSLSLIKVSDSTGDTVGLATRSIESADPLRPPTILVPRSVSRRGVLWQSLTIARGSPVQLFSISQTLFLPVQPQYSR